MTGPDTRGSESDPLQALREELAGVAPSPEFAARVRQELDVVGGQQTSWWGWAKWLGVVAPAVVVVVIVAASTFRPGPTAPSPDESGTQALALPAPLTSQPEREIARERAPEHPSTSAGPEHLRTRPGNLRTRPENPSTPAPEHPSTRAPENPELVVITNQPQVLRALWARARAQAGAVLVEVPAAPLLDGAVEIVVTPIEVNPIVVPWLVEPPASPGSQPIIR